MRLERKNAASMEEVILEFLKHSSLGLRHNVSLVFQAWDDVSGAAEYTQKRFFRDGTLYITLSSSVMRSSLYLRRDQLVAAINERLALDPLFIRDSLPCGSVRKLVLK